MKIIKRLLLFVLLTPLVLVAIATLWFINAKDPGAEPTPIISKTLTAPAFIGEPAQAKPIQADLFNNPTLAPLGMSTMHSDGYNSDVHPVMGPMGHDPQVRSRKGSKLPGGMCATVTFSREGNLVALCTSIAGFELHLLAPRSMELLARYSLSIRPSSFEAMVKKDSSIAMSDSSGGAYFFLDNQDRAVLIDARQRLMRVGHRQLDNGEWEFFLSDSWDLTPYVPQECFNWDNMEPDPNGECDPATAVMPDIDGNLWWVTRYGRVGTLDPETGKVEVMRFDGEEIQNGFSVDQHGVYIVSDHALYALTTDANNKPQIIWREAYDRGTQRKVGSINQGSGTTPTLMGSDYITITDNADDRINLLVYKRGLEIEGERLLCSVPLFTSGASATDNSMIAWNRSIIIENNNGYQNAMQQTDWDAITGGIMRVDLREDESGCDVVWTSDEKVPSVVPKLSSKNGLAYFYSFIPQETDENGISENAWYLIALDAETGETVFKINTGVGRNFDNNWAPISLGPDGTAYVGSSKGINAIWDATPPQG